MPGLRAGFPFIRSQPFLRYRCHGLDGAGGHLSSVYILRWRKRCARCGSETRHLPPFADDRYDHALARRIWKNQIQRTTTAVPSSLRFIGAGQSAKVRAFARKTREMFVLSHGKPLAGVRYLAGQDKEYRI